MYIKTNILTLNSIREPQYQSNVFLNIEDGIIKEIQTEIKGTYKNYTNFLALPGFIDTHVHIAQYKIRGRFRPNLLDWLNEFTFKEESKFEDPDYANTVSNEFIKEALRNGTTCVSAFMTIHKEACEIAFNNAKNAGIRAFIGKIMMDQNCPNDLKEKTSESLQNSIDLYEKWHNKHELLEYIFSPRFAPTCSWKMMKELGKYIQKKGAYVQTHLSENLNEIAWVNKLYPNHKTYTDVYYQAGLMTEKSIFGHSIHLNEEEMALFKETNAKISHCPDSNFFLKSGAFQFEKLKNNHVDFALGSDVAAGTSLNMLYNAKMSIYRQDSYMVNPVDAFYYITLGGAKVLGLEDKIGSIEAGKEADLVFYDKNETMNESPEDMIAEMIFSGQDKRVNEVLVKGRSVYLAKK